MSEADAIEAEVERRKARAKELKVPETTAALAAVLGQYPHWMADAQYRAQACPEVTSASWVAAGQLQVNFNGHTALFVRTSRSEQDADFYQMVATHAVSWDGTLVVEFDITTTYSSWDEEGICSVGDIRAFVEGEWVEAFGVLRDRAEQCLAEVSAARMNAAREDSGRLAELKRRFGIT